VAVGVIITKYFKDVYFLGQQSEVAKRCGICAVNLTRKIIENFNNTQTQIIKFDPFGISMAFFSAISQNIISLRNSLQLIRY
jgi:hypothetical protein